MTYTNEACEFNIGPTLFRFADDPGPDGRADLSKQIDDIESGKSAAARLRSLDARERLDRDHHAGRAIQYAEWRAQRLGIDLSGYERVEVEWCEAMLTAGTEPRKATARDPLPYRRSIKAVRSVKFFHDCTVSGGGYYGAPVVRTGGELLAKIDIPGWDHAAIPAAEGPVSYLYDFQERADRAAAMSALDARFARAIERVPEAAAIPAEERTRATLENLERWADAAQRREYQREARERGLTELLTDDRSDYGPPLSEWDEYARAETDEEREPARYRIALYRLYLSEGGDGRSRPFSDDVRIPSLDRAKRKALRREVHRQSTATRCVSYDYIGWRQVADADLAWHSGDVAREIFHVRQNDDRTKWALLRFTWSARDGRKLVDVSETTKLETAREWCEAIAGEPVTVAAADPERVAALSENGCFAAVQRGCYVRHVGTREACERLAGGDVVVIVLRPGWHALQNPSRIEANAQALLEGRRQRIRTMDLARWEAAKANPTAKPFHDWLQELGLQGWTLVRNLRGVRWGWRDKLGLTEKAYQALNDEHLAAVYAATLERINRPSPENGYSRAA
ncbi:hypothetical protein [Thalassobaculum litoreum]|uniref:Uncharacterized protein n=1 Tax=Thalassobaculum litoreum DSM 18839 TaxID=1123362 RepID=A0A8G2EYH1_9PROT|nr:hypothetical protein [Thalassobaculum litoreum]SDF83062.1 hypothetical protein SAMN05660686_02448 [Thalassobaculum litoreum DSM 18839]